MIFDFKRVASVTSDLIIKGKFFPSVVEFVVAQEPKWRAVAIICKNSFFFFFRPK